MLSQQAGQVRQAGVVPAGMQQTPACAGSAGAWGTSNTCGVCMGTALSTCQHQPQCGWSASCMQGSVRLRYRCDSVTCVCGIPRGPCACIVSRPLHPSGCSHVTFCQRLWQSHCIRVAGAAIPSSNSELSVWVPLARACVLSGMLAEHVQGAMLCMLCSTPGPCLVPQACATSDSGCRQVCSATAAGCRGWSCLCVSARGQGQGVC
jgi:hypothetical protein